MRNHFSLYSFPRATLFAAGLGVVLLVGCSPDSTLAPSAATPGPMGPSLSLLPPTQVYGPATFTRQTGKPKTHSATFTANAGDTATFVFSSTASQGLNADVALNGVALFNTSGGHGLPDTARAVLLANNTITVNQSGKPGSQLTISATVPTPDLVLPSDLVLYYPLNGNADDASTSGLNGSVTNGEWVPDRHGSAAGAFHVPTNDSWVVTPFASGSPISFPTSGQFSAAMWVRADSLSTGLESVIFSTGLNEFGWALGVRQNGTLFAEVCTPSEFCFSTEANPGDVPNTPLTPGQWVHVALLYDGALGRLTFYLNGARAGYVNVALSARTTDTEAWFGTAPFATQYWFRGAIDEIRVYNRLLTPAELSALSTY